MHEDFKDLIKALIVGFVVIIWLAIVIFGGAIITSNVDLENDAKRMELEYQYEIKYQKLRIDLERGEVYGPTLS